MKATSDDCAAVVEFFGKVQRIARVHQPGLKDRSSRNDIAMEYPERKLLGFSDDDIKLIEDEIIMRLN